MTDRVEQAKRPGAAPPMPSPVPDSVLLIVADQQGRASGAREMCTAQGWKYRVITEIDRVAWTASVLRPSAILVLDGGQEWTDVVVGTVRGATSAPVVVVGAMSADRALFALSQGVDAIVPPRLSAEETLARIYAIIRRSSEVLAPSTRYLESGKLTLDLWQSLLLLDGEKVHLTTIEFKLLAFLMRHAGSTVEPRKIVEHVWQSPGSGGENALRIAIGRLRQKLGDDAKTPQIIAVVRGRGYKFIPPVVEISDDERSAGPRHVQVEFLDGVAELATRFASCESPDDLYTVLVAHLVQSGFADAAAVHEVRGERLILRAHRGLSDAWAATARETAIDERYASARAVRASAPVHVTASFRKYPLTNAQLKDEGTGEYIFLPIDIGGQIRACLGLVRRSSRAFDAGSLAYLRAVIAIFATVMNALTPRR